MLRRLPPGPLPVYEATVRVIEERHGQPEATAAYLGASRSLMGVMALKRAYTKRMRSLRQPVLLLHGDRDRLVPLAVCQGSGASKSALAFRDR